MFEDFFNRFKLLIIVLLPALALTGVVMFLTRNEAVKDLKTKQAEAGAKEVPAGNPTDVLPSPNPNASLENRVKDLETAVILLNRKINTLSQAAPITPTVGFSLSSSPAPVSSNGVTSQSIGVKSVYIPIGYGGSSTSTQDFESIGQQEAIIDTGSYPGYRQMVLEANFRVANSSGRGDARIYLPEAGISILESLVSTTSGNFSTVTSKGFRLPDGNKKYTVQLKSLTGATVDLQFVRLRVDF